MAAPALALLCWSHGKAQARTGSGADGPPQSDTIVVTAPRRGEAEVPAETEFGEEDIAGYGADSIDELLDRLAPLTGASGEEPVILVNGKEVGFDRSILGYPPEALERIAVLQAQAAARYGHSPGRRVLNLVLKQNYASRHAEAGATWATRGGQHGGSLTAGQVAIAGEVRWNAQARVAVESALRRSARDVPAETGAIDLVGHVAPSGGEELDPALSELMGRPVAVAAIPASAAKGPPALADFAATASDLREADPASFETLLPSRRNLSLNLGASRPFGPFSASLSVNASSNRSERLRGVPIASVILPAASLWSPFAGDVLLVRPLAGSRALRGENGSRSLNLALTLSGRLGAWRTTVSGSYARSWADSHLERGIDTGAVRALIDAGERGFNPYGPWSDRLLLAVDSRSESESFGARLNLARPVLELRAGSATANLSVNANRNSSSYRRSDGLEREAASDTYTRDHLSGELSLSIPVSRRSAATTGPLGDLTLDLSVGGQTATGSGLRKQYGGGFTWSPTPSLEVRGTFEHREVVPSAEQLGAPRTETVRRVYDFLRQEVVEPLWLTGGNPLLHRGSRRSLSLDVRLRPLGNPALTVNVGYRRSGEKEGVAAFPELTPAIENAFPDRVVRDADGRLQVVDARAINIARTERAELVSGIALRLPEPGGGHEPADDSWRFSLSLNHTWRLKSELLTRAGVPVIDRIAETGQSRHHLSLQATAGRDGLGADLRATWSSPAQVHSGRPTGGGGDYRYRPPLMIDVGFFIEPEQIWPATEKSGWFENLKISLDVENLLDTYRKVTLNDGGVPPGFGRDEVDPLGRTVELSLRKRF